jgi:hypothetical protein
MAPKVQPNDEPNKPDTTPPPPEATKTPTTTEGKGLSHVAAPEATPAS